ncbi:MAG: CvpA family protein [Erysipelotrichaceae bacterium]
MTLPSNSVVFINIAVIAFLIISLIVGYMKGFMWQLVKTLAVLGVILLCWIIAPGLSKLIQVFPAKYAPFKDTALASVFYDKINTLCWFLIVLVAGLIIIAIIRPVFNFITELPVIKQVNKIVGAVLSIIPTFIIIVLFTYLLNTAIFTNGKEIVNNSVLKYTNVVVDKLADVLKETLAENLAIQKMLSDPLSLQTEDIANIINWLQRCQVDSQEIYDFLLKYGIDTETLNSLINSGE